MLWTEWHILLVVNLTGNMVSLQHFNALSSHYFNALSFLNNVRFNL